jgi:hypothetical protein
LTISRYSVFAEPKNSSFWTKLDGDLVGHGAINALPVR